MSTFLTALLLFAIFFAVHKFGKWRDKRIMDAAPPITQAEVDQVLDRMERMKLPLVRLVVNDAQEPGPVDTKIGGRPWRPSADEEWPLSDYKESLSFLAQINFAQIPPIEDFPGKGILQLFFKDFGPPGEDDEDGGFRFTVRWYPDPEGVLEHPLPNDLPKPRKRSWFETEAAQKIGLAIRPEYDVLRPTTYHWPFTEGVNFPGTLRHPENDKVREIVDGWEQMEDDLIDAYGTHWVGGHPQFAQDDVRHDPSKTHLDRLILHLGSDDHLMIGDAGTVNLMISQADLRARRFEKALMWMDCH